MRVASRILAPLSILILIVCLAGPLHAQAGDAAVAELTYVSTEGVYLNAGSDIGLRLGDTLEVRRGDRTIATVVINNISSKSAAAVVLAQTEAVQPGDLLFAVTIGVPPAEQPRPIKPKAAERPEKRDRKISRVRGEVALSNYWHNDMSGADLSWTRPGLSTRFTVDDIGEAGMTFEFRHRTRLYHRSREVRIGEGTDQWSHQVYELALLHDREGVSSEWGIGRIIAPYVRGVGLIDGGYFARSVSKHYKLGIAAGTSPDARNSGVDFGRRKLGIFIAYETGRYEAGRLGLSAALSTEYDHGTVSRDFIYVQGTYSKYRRLTTYHSVELDLNRDWRYDYAGDRIKLTNYFGSATVTLHRSASIFLSYDTRRSIRYFENRSVPDSLFDDLVNKGVRGGFNVRFSDRVSMRASGGIRMRDDYFDDVKNGSVSFRLSRFPARRHTVSAYFSYVKTQFTTGYRPMLVYRFPLVSRLLVTATGAAHLYETGTRDSENYFTDFASSYSFRSGLYFNGSYRQYFDTELQSTEIFTEIGYRW